MSFMIFGILATALLVSLFFLPRTKYVFSAAFGLISAVFTVLSAFSWRSALIESGKDTALLGFGSYPLAVILLFLIFAAALVCVILSLVNMIKAKNAN